MSASPHWDTGRRKLVISRTGVKTPFKGVFLCPSFCAAIGRVIHYGGVIWAWFVHGRTCSRFSTPLHATAHEVEIIGGGLFTLEQEYPQ